MKSSVIGLPNHPTVDLTLLNFGFITTSRYSSVENFDSESGSDLDVPNQDFAKTTLQLSPRGRSVSFVRLRGARRGGAGAGCCSRGLCASLGIAARWRCAEAAMALCGRSSTSATRRSGRGRGLSLHPPSAAYGRSLTRASPPPPAQIFSSTASFRNYARKTQACGRERTGC